MRISVFGIGYVGVVSSACLAEFGHEVIAVDISAEKVAMINRGQSPIIEDEIGELVASAVRLGRLQATDDAAAAVANSDISFVSVGTPSGSDGALAMNAVEAVLRSIATATRAKSAPHTIVMRSTVPPGTADGRLIPLIEKAAQRRCGEGLTYYANPEFLREGSSVKDFRTPPFTLIGAAPGDDATRLRALYRPIEAQVHLTSFRLAESVKYLSNVYHALKLTFANEAGAVLAANGVDAREAFRLFCCDHVLNVSAAYLRPGFAFGGSCLPKDLRGFLALADRNRMEVPLLRQVLPSNLSTVQRAYDLIAGYGRQPIAMFGLAFKEGTDDLRESPFVVLAERLLGRGYELRIFDRSIDVSRLLGSNRTYIESEIPHLERLLVSTPAEALQGVHLAVIGHLAAGDLPALGRALKDHTVIDLAGLPGLQSLPGITYRGFCW
jgi:GDP-mannose 6-dehydrogenase